MQRCALFGILVLAAGVLAAPATAATVRSGPAGAKFYSPPKSLPKGPHGTPVWARRLTGKAVLKNAASNRLLLYRSSLRRRQGHRGLRHRRDPEGEGAEGRLAGDHVGARDDRDRRPLRTDALGRLEGLRPPAPAALAEGRLRGRPHRLRGPRHAGRAPVPDRRLRGPQRARRGPRRARARAGARQADRDLRPLPGRPCGAVGGVDREGVDARAGGPRHGRLRARQPRRRAGRAAEDGDRAERAERPRRDDLARDRRRPPGPRTSAACCSDKAKALYPQIDAKCLLDLGKPDSFGGVAPSELFRPDAALEPFAAALDATTTPRT